MTSARLLQLALMAPSMLAMSNASLDNDFASTSSLQKRSLSSHETMLRACLLSVHRENDSPTRNIELEFLLATHEGHQNMTELFLNDIQEHIFDCFYRHEDGAAEQNFESDRTPIQTIHQNNNSPSKEWNRKAKEIGILSLTLLSIVPGKYARHDMRRNLALFDDNIANS